METCFKSTKLKCAHLSIKLNETKGKMPSNKGDSQNGYSLKYQRGIKNSIKQLQKALS